MDDSEYQAVDAAAHRVRVSSWKRAITTDKKAHADGTSGH